jgi:hypothetical protein
VAQPSLASLRPSDAEQGSARAIPEMAPFTFVAAIIAVEKTVPWRRRVVTYATAALLLVLGILVLVAPDVLPALTIPAGDPMPMA